MFDFTNYYYFIQKHFNSNFAYIMFFLSYFLDYAIIYILFYLIINLWFKKNTFLQNKIKHSENKNSWTSSVFLLNIIFVFINSGNTSSQTSIRTIVRRASEDQSRAGSCCGSDTMKTVSCLDRTIVGRTEATSLGTPSSSCGRNRPWSGPFKTRRGIWRQIDGKSLPDFRGTRLDFSLN